MIENNSLQRLTQFVHHDRPNLDPCNVPLVTPLHQSVKYKPINMTHLRQILTQRNVGYIYSRVCNPTVRELEELLAKIQGTEDGHATSSGIAALTTVAMTFLKTGDHAVVFTESYKPTRFLLSGIMGKFGVITSRLDRDEYQKLEELFKGSNPPKIIFLESPTNPTLRIHDLEWITSLAKKHNCLTVLDNTFAGFEHHGQWDVDIYVHSLTKQACGHSDAMGGMILGKKSLIDTIFPIAITMGGCLDPHSAWLILRGMKTYGLRSQTTSANALDIAQWLTTQNWATNIRYPAFENHPDHELWKKQNRGDGGSVVTFDLICKENSTQDCIDRFFESLKIFSLTPSVGCVESLAAPCYLLFGDDLGIEQAAKVGINIYTIRLALGIEDVKDLKQDLSNAARTALNR